jgi:predicted nucleotide-binding protein
MAKRIINKTEPIMTILEIDKEEFKTVLNERISLGESLLKTEIRTRQDLDNLGNEFYSWDDYNTEFLKQSFNNPNNEYKANYDDAGYSIFGVIGGNDNPVLEKQSLIKAKIEDLKKLVAKTNLLKSSIQTHPKPVPATILTKSVSQKVEVFIVHGHDETARVKTARFIEKLGFKPIILHEQASSGKTIIEKIEEFSNVGFGIVLYTPCDIGGKLGDEQKLNPRARQNVIFEHGYLIGKIGRENVCALVKGNIETPNDISGVVYVNMDEAEAWEVKIAKELRNSGYNVDMNKL